MQIVILPFLSGFGVISAILLLSSPQVISGIFGKKTFGPKKMKEESIDNAFLST